MDLIGIVFVNIQNDKLLRLMRGDLTAKLTADRTAATGDQHHLAADEIKHFPQVDLDGVSAQKILHGDLAHGINGHFTVQKLINTGQLL